MHLSGSRFIAAGAVTLFVALMLAGWWLTRAPVLAVTGTQLNQPVPDIPLTDQDGQPFRLSDLRGKVVVVYPFLTDCREICPMTTAAFIKMARALDAAGLRNEVALLEVTVDPERDTPERLHAYAELSSASWTMLTGSPKNLGRFWAFFGVSTERTAIESPGPIDWYTHEPATYDVGHTPALMFIDAQGNERIVLVGTADVGRQLPSQLEAMLSDQGRQNLAAPQQPWTVEQALDDVGVLLGRPIPTNGNS